MCVYIYICISRGKPLLDVPARMRAGAAKMQTVGNTCL